MAQETALIGAGYIGQRVLELWPYHPLRTTTTTKEKLPQLLSRGAVPFLLSSQSPVDEWARFFDGVKRIIVTANSLLLAKILTHFSFDSVLFTSSTSAYNHPHEIEAVYETMPTRLCILRFAGLYGPLRELSKRAARLSGTLVPGPSHARVNILSQENAARSILWAYTNELEGTYCICEDAHPTKEDLYGSLCREQNLPPPQFDPSKEPLHGNGKALSAQCFIDTGFTFV